VCVGRISALAAAKVSPAASSAATEAATARKQSLRGRDRSSLVAVGDEGVYQKCEQTLGDDDEGQGVQRDSGDLRRVEEAEDECGRPCHVNELIRPVGPT
jgi:hypothetical protein